MNCSDLRSIVLMCVVIAGAHARAEGEGNLEWHRWEQSNGGNGHLYAAVVNEVTWFEAEEAARAKGVWLATLELPGENEFVNLLIDDLPEIWRPGDLPTSPWLGPWLGGFQDPTGIEPGGGWFWLPEGNVGDPTSFVDTPTH